ncbi:MAG: bifunctional hydroxymethylpyrimidine kinase/phosphomethylpyrimidine kinase [Fimbriimonadaceae bacterium]|nr:MAG: bifunctional hydroxymethylpyrimidine kinase/phosphomethylpyrimidine kinase [Fimbriimonadaceae bacterium]
MSFRLLLEQFVGVQALVVGDVMLDEYIFGRATRISPEAPVMVVRQEGTRAVPGGAANVAKNLAALGAKVRLIGVVGDDAAGRALAEALATDGIEARLVRDPARVTTRKTRVLADSAHQVLRIDEESTGPLSSEAEAELLEAVAPWAAAAQVSVLSDYSKGALQDGVAAAVVRESRVSVVNAKPNRAERFQGASLVTVNRAEASALLGGAEVSPEHALGQARAIAAKIGVRAVAITMGGEGLVASTPNGEFQCPAPKVEVYDTAGAGDTACATLALGLAVAGYEEPVFKLAVATSAEVVRKVGVAVPSREDLVRLQFADQSPV